MSVRVMVATDDGKGLLYALERMYHERPEAMENFAEWIGEPSHTQTVTLRWREGRLQAVELSRTSR